jgi:hypothetical protein
MRSVFDGALEALFRTPPFQRLKQSIDSAQGERIMKVQQYLASRISKQLWGSNYPRYQAHLDANKAKKEANAERGI